MVNCVSWWQHGSVALCYGVLSSLCPCTTTAQLFCFIKDFYLLRLDLTLNSLRDLNHIFLVLIRMLYKGSLCFLAVYISFTFLKWEIAVRGGWCGARLGKRNVYLYFQGIGASYVYHLSAERIQCIIKISLFSTGLYLHAFSVIMLVQLYSELQGRAYKCGSLNNIFSPIGLCGQ